MKRVVIDTDPGIDDAHAIMMALRHPGTQVEALTIVGGNVPLPRTVANACTILDVMDADVPVFRGCAGPLISGAQDASHVHGLDGLGDANFAPSERVVENEHAAQALVRLANEAPGALSLVAVGPLTNVALAMKLDPQLPQKYRELVVMGGAIRAMGNTPNLSAEFNIYSDPEAAMIVLSAWPDVTLVSWETTLAHGFEEAVVRRWLAHETPAARFFERITEKIIAYNRDVMKRSVLFGADALAMAVALEPEIVTEAERHHVAVELHGSQTRGQTTVDWFDRSSRQPLANIILKVEQGRFLELMEMALR